MNAQWILPKLDSAAIGELQEDAFRKGSDEKTLIAGFGSEVSGSIPEAQIACRVQEKLFGLPAEDIREPQKALGDA